MCSVLEAHTGEVNSVAWSPDGNRLASGGKDQHIRVWNPLSGQELISFRSDSEEIYSIAWSSIEGRIVTGSDYKHHTVTLWDVKTARAVSSNDIHTGGIFEISWSSDSKMYATSSGLPDNRVIIWDTKTGKDIKTLRIESGALSISWLPNKSILAISDAEKSVQVWDISQNKKLYILEEATKAVISVSFSSNGNLLATKSVDGTIRIWRLDTWGKALDISETHGGMWLSGLGFHPHLPILATLGEKDTIIRIWEYDEAILLGQAKENVNYTTAKLVLVGDSGVGKTGLGWRLAHGEFKEHASTHGQQFWSIPELGLKRKDGTDCEAVLWDLAGQHVYRQVHSIFLENVAAALVLFDPSNRQDPLKGAQFWLEQLKDKGNLPPTVLVGARVDRGAPALSQADLDQFCQRYGITGGYLSTSAMSGEGLDALMEKLKAQIPWEDMTATVTTVTFKRIKDYVLSLKEKTDRKGVLVSPSELRKLLETATVDLHRPRNDDRRRTSRNAWLRIDSAQFSRRNVHPAHARTAGEYRRVHHVAGG